jgi:hypothetical protein
MNLPPIVFCKRDQVDADVNRIKNWSNFHPLGFAITVLQPIPQREYSCLKEAFCYNVTFVGEFIKGCILGKIIRKKLKECLNGYY